MDFFPVNLEYVVNIWGHSQWFMRESAYSRIKSLKEKLGIVILVGLIYWHIDCLIRVIIRILRSMLKSWLLYIHLWSDPWCWVRLGLVLLENSPRSQKTDAEERTNNPWSSSHQSRREQSLPKTMIGLQNQNRFEIYSGWNNKIKSASENKFLNKKK